MLKEHIKLKRRMRKIECGNEKRNRIRRKEEDDIYIYIN